jgi:hypothetical protein
MLALAVMSASAAHPTCPAGMRQARTAQLIFGRDIGDHLGVGAADWRAFLDREVTTRFPDGFTVLDARGQWRGRGGALVREPSKILLVVLSGAPGEEERLAGIARAYKSQFRQQAVLMIEQDACAAS